MVTTPLLHDSPDELAQPHGKIKDWERGEAEPVPGKTMPHIHVVERDYAAVYDKMTALGPLIEEKPRGIKGIQWSMAEEYELLKKVNGTSRKNGIAHGCPDLTNDVQVCEAILTLSSTSNGKVAVKAWEALEEKKSLSLKDLAKNAPKSA